MFLPPYLSAVKRLHEIIGGRACFVARWHQLQGSNAAPPPPDRPRVHDGQGAVVVERQTSTLKPPSMYKVVLLNDDYTPMEFVVMVLQEYFKHDLETATQIMLMVHREGRGVCGVYTKDVAATKVELVLAAARRGGHPLQCVMEAT